MLRLFIAVTRLLCWVFDLFVLLRLLCLLLMLLSISCVSVLLWFGLLFASWWVLCCGVCCCGVGLMLRFGFG